MAAGANTGTEVGITAHATDPNGGSLTYSLADNAGGRFAIDPTTGVVTVANASLIDAAIATSHAIVVKASDPGGAYSTQTFSIDVGYQQGYQITGTSEADHLKANAHYISSASAALIKGKDASAAPSGHNTDFIIDGRGGNDMLIAAYGNDELFGRSGKDVLKGKNGNDHLDGGSGCDKLRGGPGDDLLAGGKGKDLLRGGHGQDAFLFDTKLGHGQVDHIVHFHVGVDTIVLDFSGVHRRRRPGRTRSVPVSNRRQSRRCRKPGHLQFADRCPLL